MAQELSAPLKYQTWVLKVSIHCEGCKRKVKKVLQRIDGVYTTNIDAKQHKVTVTGDIAAETLIKKLVKTGKHAEMWPENIAGNSKKSGKSKTNDKQENPQNGIISTSEEKENQTENAEEKHTKNQNSVSENASEDVKVPKSGGGSPEKAIAGEKCPETDQSGSESNAAAQTSGGGGGGKRKKRRGQKGANSTESSSATTKDKPEGIGLETQNLGTNQVMMDQINLNPTHQHLGFHQPTYIPRPVYLWSYSAASPSTSAYGPSYYVSSSPYSWANTQPEEQGSFEILSDEDPTGCYIM